MQENDKESVARRLPSLYGERKHLLRERSGSSDTTGGDAFVVGIVGAVGAGIAIVIGGTIGASAYSAGVLAGLVATAIALVAGGAAAWACVVLSRTLLMQQERGRRTRVAALSVRIRRLDKQIAKAYVDHGLTGSAPVAPY